mgnify:CR=1 FL=1
MEGTVEPQGANGSQPEPREELVRRFEGLVLAYHFIDMIYAAARLAGVIGLFTVFARLVYGMEAVVDRTNWLYLLSAPLAVALYFLSRALRRRYEEAKRRLLM